MADGSTHCWRKLRTKGCTFCEYSPAAFNGTIKQPSILLRAMVLGAQGVFFNLFFLTYLFSPRSAHRFVGHLEEQATYTYTQCIKDMEEGLIPEWNDMPAPKIAIVSNLGQN
jgi:hypothetical protein